MLFRPGHLRTDLDMRRPLPTLAISVGLTIALFALFGQVRAEPQQAGLPAENDPEKFPKVRVDPIGGTPLTGKLRQSAITLKTDIGATVIGTEHIRRITFQKDPEGKSNDIIQLADKSMVRGHVVADHFLVDRDGGGEVTLRKAEIRQIAVIREVPLPWTAIFFGLLMLTLMEIILGIDNIVFLAIVVAKLPEAQQPKARKLGLAAALGTRILLLFSLSFLLSLTTPVFTLPTMPFLHDLDSREVSWRDIILLVGGLFLIAKSVHEIHKKLEESKAAAAASADPAAPPPVPGEKPASFTWTIVTIAVIDIVFSLDSVVTAVGMVEQVWVMVIAMTLAMLVMLYFAGPIGRFVEKHPTLKVLALAFLILIGVMLVAEGMGQHMDKGYIYAAMAFAVLVEMINMQIRRPKKKKEPPALPGSTAASNS